VIHWPLVPLANGTLDDRFGLIAQSADLVARAHAAGVKAILGVGANFDEVGTGWRDATAPGIRATLITNMINAMQAGNYDGIDINWEELDWNALTAGERAQFTALMTELRTALDGINPRPLLTIVPTTGNGADVVASLIGPIQDRFDQINLQTYVMSGPYPGWVTWFNSPIFNGGATFPATADPLPSADAEVARFVNGGIPVSNLGIGIQFDGAVWTGGAGTPTGGVSAPQQEWGVAPTMEFKRSAEIITNFVGQPGYTKTFDTVAKVPWIGHDDANDALDQFISYDDEQAIQEKANYIATKGLAGVFVFEVSGDFFPAAIGDARHPLLTALRNAFPRGFAFTDVPSTYWAYAHIQALARAGVTSGCATNPLRFCPEDSVTREQMAVFLLKGALGAGYTPPPCTTAAFADVPCSSVFAPWIQDLVNRGITIGCGGGLYCPTSPVTREQMAVFLLRSVGLLADTLAPCAPPGPFTDVPCSSIFAPWIQELVARSITFGCTATTYCPTTEVTRAQMAVFLVKTFALPL
jgi:chitinase